MSARVGFGGIAAGYVEDTVIINIDPSGTVGIVEAGNFRGFHIAGTKPRDTATRSSLAEQGIHFDDALAQAFVEPDTVRSLAKGDRDWEIGFGSMIDYAKSKGWIDDQGRIGAHTEWDA